MLLSAPILLIQLVYALMDYLMFMISNKPLWSHDYWLPNQQKKKPWHQLKMSDDVNVVIKVYYPPRNVVEGGYTGISLSVRLSGCLAVRLSVSDILSADLLRNYWTDFAQIWHRCSLGWVVVPPDLASQGANPKGDSNRKCGQKRAFCEQIRNYWSNLIQIWHRCSLGWVDVHPKLASQGANPKGDSNRKCGQKRAFWAQLQNYLSDFIQIWHRCSLGWVVVPPKLASQGANPTGDSNRKCG